MNHQRLFALLLSLSFSAPTWAEEAHEHDHDEPQHQEKEAKDDGHGHNEEAGGGGDAELTAKQQKMAGIKTEKVRL